MVLEYIRYEIPEHRHSDFVAAYEAAGRELSASEHCIRFDVSQGVEEPENFVVRIEWDSVEGHEQGFRRSELFAPFLARVRPFFDLIREMKHYRPLQQGEGGASQ